MAKLYIYNDDKNTFDYVVGLIKYNLNYPILQAESIANIIHHNGKCCVKVGTKQELIPLLEFFIKNNLKTEILNERKSTKKK
jgi:ATP-dependent Clp protease adaptor protein ClpS